MLHNWFSPPTFTSWFLRFKIRFDIYLLSNLISLLTVHFFSALSKIPLLCIRIYLFTDRGHLGLHLSICNDD